MMRFGLVLAALLVSAGYTAAGHAATTTVSTLGATGWLQSTTTDIYDTDPWPGAVLPGAGTFTLAATAGSTAAGNGLYASSGVLYFENSFTLPAFTSITVALTTRADNNMQIFINGNELAMYGTDLNGFSRSPFSLSIDADGTVSNGVSGGSSFSRFTSSFSTSNWISGGNNLIEVAVRNLSGGDQGGLVLDMTLTTTESVPEPFSLAVLGIGLLGLGLTRRKRT